MKDDISRREFAKLTGAGAAALAVGGAGLTHNPERKASTSCSP